MYIGQFTALFRGLLSIYRLQLRPHVVKALPPVFSGGASTIYGLLASYQWIRKLLYKGKEKEIREEDIGFFDSKHDDTTGVG